MSVPLYGYYNFSGTTLPILATPIIFSYVIVQEPDDYLKNHFHFPWMLIVIVFVSHDALLNPLLNFWETESKNGFAQILKGRGRWMRESEDDTKKLSDMMMQMNTFWSMVFDLFLSACLPLLWKRLCSGDVLQTIFLRWTKNMHVAVWITAILFSAFHMEFFGFLPRMFLGVLFGYFVAWSGSIWPAIWAHFVNNGT